MDPNVANFLYSQLIVWKKQDYQPSTAITTMAQTLNAQQKITLINSHLQEVLKPEIIEDVLIKQNRPLIIYWGL